MMAQLLDSGEILESTEKINKSRHKPLPATYEPGTEVKDSRAMLDARVVI